ncbi:MAG: FHA domain-containing protein [Pirellulales bacterium]
MTDSDRTSPERHARDLIQRAANQIAAERVSSALNRMEDDDERDRAEGSLDGTSHEPSGLLSDDTGPEGESPSATVSEQDLVLDSTLGLSSGALRRRAAGGRSDPSQADKAEMTSDFGPPAAGGLITTPAYRPSQRPPAALMQVFDDDQDRGELVRIRRTPFDIGRQEGDLTVPHELQMSRRHARIDRRQVSGEWHWYLRDLGSTNGTFVRARRVRLRDKDEVLLGADLVRFLQPGGPETATLVKVAPGRYEEKVTLKPGVHWIGTSSSQCLPLLQGSKFLDPKHLRLEVDAQGQWRLFDCGSTNHVWVRVEEVRLVDGCCFQAGEQRFSFHLP